MNIEVVQIKKLIYDNNMTVKEFAETIGLTKQTVYDYLTEKTQLKVKTLRLISEKFNVPVSYFLEETGIVNKGVLCKEKEEIINEYRKIIDQQRQDIEFLKELVNSLKPKN